MFFVLFFVWEAHFSGGKVLGKYKLQYYGVMGVNLPFSLFVVILLVDTL